MPEFGVIYASGSKLVRRIIADSPNLAAHVGPGEALLVVQQTTVPTVFDAEAAVEIATGVTPVAPQYAIVDKAGVINGIIRADPTLDSVEGHSLIAIYEGVSGDCIYDAASKLFVAPDKIIEAGTPLTPAGEGSEVAAVDIAVDGGPVAKPVEITPLDPVVP